MAYVTKDFEAALKSVLLPKVIVEETKIIESVNLDEYSIDELQEYILSEDYEQLDELSKALLGQYIGKAHFAGGMADFQNGMMVGKIKTPTADKKTKAERLKADGVSDKRTKGIDTAVRKLTKESTTADLEAMLQESKLASSRIQDLLDRKRAEKDDKADSYDYPHNGAKTNPTAAKKPMRNIGAYGKSDGDDNEGSGDFSSKVKNAAPEKRGRGRPRKNT